MTARATPAQPLALEPRADGRDPMFQHAMDYLSAQFALVEPLYQLEQSGKFKAERTPPDPEAVAFIEGQVLTAGQMLANIWLTAWRSAAPDAFLRGQLVRQRAEISRPVGN